jgi:hypothetical protein
MSTKNEHSGRMMTMVRIETNGQWRPSYHADWRNGKLQELLGGNLEVIVEQDLPGLVAYCNDNGRNYNGRNDKLPENKVVNEKLWVLFNMQSKPPVEASIVGPVVISRTGENGDECGLLPSDLVDISKLFGPCVVDA